MGLFSRILAGSKPRHSAPLEGADVDPPALSTDAGRQIAARIKTEIDKAELQCHRLSHVMKEYLFCSVGGQQSLAEAAIFWAYALLAENEGAERCKAHFFSVVDIMYAGTDDAKATYDESGRRQIVRGADLLRQSLIETVNAIGPSSAETLDHYADDNIRRIAGDMLGRILQGYIDHAPRPILQDFTIRCITLSTSLDPLSSQSNTQEAHNDVSQLIRACNALLSAVHGAGRRS